VYLHIANKFLQKKKKIPSNVVTIVIASLFSVCMLQSDVPRKGGTELYVTGRSHGGSDKQFGLNSCYFLVSGSWLSSVWHHYV
jgi:hypothetical protein